MREEIYEFLQTLEATGRLEELARVVGRSIGEGLRVGESEQRGEVRVKLPDRYMDDGFSCPCCCVYWPAESIQCACGAVKVKR